MKIGGNKEEFFQKEDEKVTLNISGSWTKTKKEKHVQKNGNQKEWKQLTFFGKKAFLQVLHKFLLCNILRFITIAKKF